MTRPIGLLLIAALGMGPLSGCALLGFQREADRPAPSPPRPVHKEDTRFKHVLGPPAKIEYPTPSEGTKPPLLLPPPTDLPPPKAPDNLVPPPSVQSTVEDVITPPTPAGSPTAQVTEPPGLPRDPAVEALNSILEGRHDEALTHLKKYDEATQELILRLLPPLAILTRKSISEFNAAEVAALHDGMARIVDIIRPRTELVIARACFCERVNSFGNYRPLPETHQFLASAPNRPGERAQLYVAVKNFNNELRKDYYETRLSSSVEIHDSKGEKIWFYRFEDRDKPMRTTEPLHDCFNNYSFFVPNLPSGNYTLTIRIADETLPDRRREARKSLEFRVGAAVQ